MASSSPFSASNVKESLSVSWRVWLVAGASGLAGQAYALGAAGPEYATEFDLFSITDAGADPGVRELAIGVNFSTLTGDYVATSSSYNPIFFRALHTDTVFYTEAGARSLSSGFSSGDFLALHGASQVSINSGVIGGSGTTTVFDPHTITSGSNLHYLYNPSLRFDASTQGDYTVDVALRLDLGTQMAFKTSDNSGTPSASTVTLNKELTGTGTLAQEGSAGAVVLNGSSPNFQGDLKVDRQITGKALVSAESLIGSSAGAEYLMDMAATSGSPVVGFSFNGTSQVVSAEWSALISGSNAYIGVTTATQNVVASSESTFAGGVTISGTNATNGIGGTGVTLGSDSTFASSQITQGPLGVGSVSIPSGVLDLNGRSLHNSITSLTGTVANRSGAATATLEAQAQITLGATGSPGLHTGAKDLLVRGIIQSPAVNTPKSLRITRDSGGAGYVEASGANTFTGLSIDGGKFRMGADEVKSDGVVISSPCGIGSITIDTNGVLDLNGHGLSQSISQLKGVLANYSLTTDALVNSTASIALTTDANSIETGAESLRVLQVDSVISGNGRTLTTRGSGTVLASGLNTFASLNVESGTFKMGRTESLSSYDAFSGYSVNSSPVGVGRVTVGSSGALDIAGNNMTNSPFYLSGILKNTTTGTLNGNSAPLIGFNTNGLINSGIWLSPGHSISVDGDIRIVSCVLDGTATSSNFNLEKGVVSFEYNGGFNSGYNSYTGKTYIGKADGSTVAGLRIGKIRHLPIITSGTSENITLYPNGTLELSYLANNQTLPHNIESRGILQYAPVSGDASQAITLTGALSGISGAGGTTTFIVGAGGAYPTANMNVVGLNEVVTYAQNYEKYGAGTVTLTGASNTTGVLGIRSGTIALGSGGRLPVDGSVAMGDAILDLENVASGVTLETKGLSGTASSLNGAGSLIKLGAHSLRVTGTGADTYYGSITGSGDWIRSGGSTALKGAGFHQVTFTGGLVLENAGKFIVESGSPVFSKIEGGATEELQIESGANVQLYYGAGSTPASHDIDVKITGSGLLSPTGTFTYTLTPFAITGVTEFVFKNASSTFGSATGGITLSGSSNTYAKVKAGADSVFDSNGVMVSGPFGLGKVVGSLTTQVDLNGKTIGNAIHDMSYKDNSTGVVYSTLGNSSSTEAVLKGEYVLRYFTTPIDLENPITIEPGIAGTNMGIAKYGSAALTLKGANTFTAPLVIYKGAIKLIGANAGVSSLMDLEMAGSAGSQALFDMSGSGNSLEVAKFFGTTDSVVKLGANTLTTVPTADVAYAGVLEGTGGLVVGAEYDISRASHKLTLTGNNTHSGGISVRDHLEFSGNNTGSVGSYTAGPIGLGTLTILEHGQADYGSNNLFNAISLGGKLHLLANGSSSTPVSVIGNIALTSDSATIASSHTGGTAITGAISGAHVLNLSEGSIDFQNTGSYKSLSIGADGAASVHISAAQTLTQGVTLHSGSTIDFSDCSQSSTELASYDFASRGSVKFVPTSASRSITLGDFTGIAGSSGSTSFQIGSSAYTDGVVTVGALGQVSSTDYQHYDKSGEGILIVSSDSPFTGDLSISKGTVKILDNVAFGVEGARPRIRLLGGALDLTDWAQTHELIVENVFSDSVDDRIALGANGSLTITGNSSQHPVYAGTISGGANSHLSFGGEGGGAWTLTQAGTAFEGALHLPNASSTIHFNANFQAKSLDGDGGATVVLGIDPIPGNPETPAVNSQLTLIGTPAGIAVAPKIQGHGSVLVNTAGNTVTLANALSSHTDDQGGISAKVTAGTLRLGGSSVINSAGDGIEFSPVGLNRVRVETNGLFDIAGYALHNDVTLQGKLLNSSGDGSIESLAVVRLFNSTEVSVGSGASLSVHGAITDNEGGYTLTKTGAGTLLSDHVESAFGALVVSEGTFKAGCDSTYDGGITQGPAGAGLITVSADATLDLLQSKIDNNVTLSGALTSSSAGSRAELTQYSTLTLASSTSELSAQQKLTLSGKITGTNGLKLSHGELALAHGTLTNFDANDVPVMTYEGSGASDFSGAISLGYGIAEEADPLDQIAAVLSFATEADLGAYTGIDVHPFAILKPGADVRRIRQPVVLKGTLDWAGSNGAQALILAQDLTTIYNATNDSSAVGTLSVATGASLETQGAVHGANYHKLGSGEWRVSSAMDYTGMLTVGDGSLVLTPQGRLSATGSIDLRKVESVDDTDPSTPITTYSGTTLDLSAAYGDSYAPVTLQALNLIGAQIAEGSDYPLSKVILGANSLKVLGTSSYDGIFTGSGNIVCSGHVTLSQPADDGFTGGYELLSGAKLTLHGNQSVPTYIEHGSNEVELLGSAIFSLRNTTDLSLTTVFSGTGTVSLEALKPEGSSAPRVTLSGQSTVENWTIKNAAVVKAGANSLLSTSANPSLVSGPFGIGAVISEASSAGNPSPVMDLGGWTIHNDMTLQNLVNSSDTTAHLYGALTMDGVEMVIGSVEDSSSSTRAIELHGSIDGENSSLIKKGASKLTLWGECSFGGSVDLQGGSLILKDGATLPVDENGYGTANFTLSSGTTLDLSGVYGEVIEVSGADPVLVPIAVKDLNGVNGANILIGSKTLKVFNDVNACSYAGSLTGSSGTFIKEGDADLTLSGSLSSFISGTFHISGPVKLTQSSNLSLLALEGSGSVSLDGILAGGAAHTLTLSSDLAREVETTITGLGGLVKKGSGTLIVSSNNTFSGGLSIDAGTLTLGHAHAMGSGSVEVKAAGSLDLAGLTPTGLTSLKLYGALTNTDLDLNDSAATLNTLLQLYDGASINIDSNLVLAAGVSGEEGFNKLGAGALTLTTSSAYSGPVALNGSGAVYLSGLASLPQARHIAVNTHLHLETISENSLTLNGVTGSSTGILFLGEKTLVLGSEAGDNPSVTHTYAGMLSGERASKVTVGAAGYTLSGDNSDFIGTLDVGTHGVALTGDCQLSQLLGTGPVTIADTKMIIYNVAGATSADSITTPLHGEGSFYVHGSAANANSRITLAQGSAGCDLTGSVGITGSSALSLQNYGISSTASGFFLGNTAELDLYGTDPQHLGYRAYAQPVQMTSDLGANPVLSNRGSHIVRLGNLQFLGTGAYTLLSDGGAIEVTGITGSPATLHKTGSADLVLGAGTVFSGQNLNVTQGRMRIKGSIEAQGYSFSQPVINIQSNAILSLENSSIDLAKVVLATPSGAGSLEIRGGWLDLQGGVSGLAQGVHVLGSHLYGAESLDRAIVSVYDNFVPTGPITVDGILAVTLSSEKTWLNTMTGSGLLKKYGQGTLNLYGNLAGFEGGLVVYEGVVQAHNILSGNLEVYAGASLLADIDNLTGQSLELGGDLFGYLLTNNGDIRLGNHQGSTSIISMDTINGNGSWIMDASSMVRVRAISQNNTLSSLDVQQGQLFLDGSFSKGDASTYVDNMWIHNGGTVSFEPGSSYDGRIGIDQGSLKVKGFNIDRSISLEQGSVRMGAGSLLDITVDCINNERSVMSVNIGSLHAQVGAQIILRPDVELAHGDQDAALLTIGQLSIQDTLPITVIPLGLMTASKTIKLIQITGGYTTEGLELVGDNIQQNLRTNGLCTLENISFLNGILWCEIAPVNVTQVMHTATFIELPLQYRSLGSSILSQAFSGSEFTANLTNMIVNAETPEQMNKIIRSLTPSSSSENTQGLSLAPQQGLAGNMLQAARVQQSSAALVAQSPQLKAFVNKGLKAQLSGANTMGRHVSKARDSGTDIRIQDFQTVDLTGLSFSSETSYSHQVTEPHGVETPGFTQNSWASSMGVSLSKNPEVTLGALLMTTKNQLELNANQIDQLMTRDDRTNTIGALALYQPEGTSWVMTTVVTYGMHNYEGDRTWEQGLPSGDFVTTRALSSYNSYETYISSELGHRVRLDECSIFHPYMGWALSHETKLAYEEDATTVQDGTSSEYGLLVPKQSTTNLALHAGVEFVQIAKVLDMTYQVITKMGMTTQKNTGDYASYRYAYAGDPSVYHSVNSKNQRYNTLDLSFGIHAAITPNFYISGMYAGNYGKQGNTHTAMLNVEYAI